MTEVGRRPTLYELLLALHAIESVEADIAAHDPEAKTFRVVLTFTRAQCPNDWIEGKPKPSWMFEQLTEELAAWLQQRNREEQWVSKEEQMGSSIDTLMAHYTEELKKVVKASPQNMLTRMQKRIFEDTILRLKELKERRAAGGVYSQTESRREKARKQWEDDEYEAPKREEQQRRQQQARDFGGFQYRGFDDLDPEMARQTREAFSKFFNDNAYGWGPNHGAATPPPKSNNKQPWHVTLGVPISATKEEITKAYRKLVAKYQPRTSADAEDKERHDKMTEINTARDEGLGGL